MKTAIPAIFVIIALLSFGCSEDDYSNNTVSKVRYYNSASGFNGENEFVYDNSGRIAKTIWHGNDGSDKISEFTYDDNLLTIDEGEFVQHILKFENDQLTQYSVKQKFDNDTEREDIVNFSYESGSLKTISYNDQLHTVDMDVKGNITGTLRNGFNTDYEYDKRTNPFQKIPGNFFSGVSDAAQGRDLLLSEVIRYFSGNNAMTENILRYEYVNGKVSKIVSRPYSYGYNPTQNITEKIAYQIPLLSE